MLIINTDKVNGKNNQSKREKIRSEVLQESKKEVHLYHNNSNKAVVLNQSKMNTELKRELASRVLDRITDGVLTNENREDWHFHSFNEDYYIIGYAKASEWLKRHDIDVFEGIETCNKYETDNFGEIYKTYKNSEELVNMLAYIYGEELLCGIDVENIEELETACNEIINA